MKKLSLLLSIVYFLFSVPALAAVMSSTNFQIISDAISGGGAALSTSTNFGIADTLNFGAAGATSTSSNFIEADGFQNTTAPDNLTVTFSKNTINLGTLSTASVSSDNQTLTVTSNSPNGYTTTVQTDGELRAGSNTIQSVSGSITAGVAGYGVSTSGSNGQFSSLTSISTTSKTIARSSIPVTAAVTTINYQATISGSTAPGDYSQIVTFTTTANF